MLSDSTGAFSDLMLESTCPHLLVACNARTSLTRKQDIVGLAAGTPNVLPPMFYTHTLFHSEPK